MKSPAPSVVVLVTAPDLKVARKLAQVVLTARLAACVQLVPKIESHYWWEGKITSSAEVLLVLKTVRKQVKSLEKLVLANHPYDTPEFVVLSITAGNRRYLDWLAVETKPSA